MVAGVGALPGAGVVIHPGAGGSVSATAGAVIMAGVVSTPVGVVSMVGRDIMADIGVILTMDTAVTTVATGDIHLT